MKKSIFIYALVTIVSFCIGYFTCQKCEEQNYEFLIEANDFKRELIEIQWNCIEMANKVMNNHNLWDIDDSQDMSDYLDLYCTADSLCATQL